MLGLEDQCEAGLGCASGLLDLHPAAGAGTGGHFFPGKPPDEVPDILQEPAHQSKSGGPGCSKAGRSGYPDSSRVQPGAAPTGVRRT